MPADLRRAYFFVQYFDLIRASGAVPLSLPSNSWHKVGFLNLANALVTYQLTSGIHVPLWAFSRVANVARKGALLNGEVA